MLNLSDKELDRLSRDASDQYDPESFTGSGSWDKLEWRLDKELGRISRPNPFRGLRGIRRIPFYYAPVIVLLVGVSYYFIKHAKNSNVGTSSTSPAAAHNEPSGSPPLSIVKPMTPSATNNDSATKSLTNTYNSTSTPTQDQGTQQPVSGGITAPNDHSSAAPGTASGNPSTASAHPPTGDNAAPAGTTAAPGAGSTAAANPSTVPGTSSSSGTSSTANPSTTSAGLHHTAAPGALVSSSANHDAGASGHQHRNNHPALPPPDQNGSADASVASGTPNRPGATHPTGVSNHPGTTNPSNTTSAPAITNGSNPSGSSGAAANPTAFQLREAKRSIVSTPHSLAKRPAVDDSGLRAITKNTAIATPIKLDKKNGPSLHVNRPLQFGLLLAPDFSSVNALAGDKPGSSIGITVDYQFLHRLYLSTGLLLTRKNYAALPDNYHVPRDYYQNNNIHDVSLIKGTFSMLEIPLNLRYDFSITGNTMFFVSGGFSSYLFATESSQYYYSLFGRQACQNFNTGQGSPTAVGKNYLFSSVNLSMGVETGISNSLSLMIAPYMKFPAAGIGFGHVQMNSLGVNFSLRYAPVLSRKRH